ncbi:MAG: acyltransferase [Clostridia bacterium]|nr:acyltransferase [Clostridia bacterium]
MKLKEISLMNVLMCFSVITIHLTSNPVALLRHDSFWYLVMFIINKFLTFAVPAFVFLSGFKLYNKYNDNKIDLKNFYIGRVKKIIIPYLIAFLVYFLFYIFENLIEWNDFFHSLLLGTLVAHFYYILIAIQLYLIFPLLHILFEKLDKIMLVLSFISTIIFNQFVFFEYNDRFCGTYIFYFILGMFVAKHYTKKEIRPFWGYVVGFVSIALIHIYLCYKMSLDDYWYKYSGIGQVLYVSLSCVLIYNLCIKNKSKGLEKMIDFINPHTFYIFLYHILVMNILQFVIYPHLNLSIKYQFTISFIIVYFVIFIYCGIRNLKKKKEQSE